MTKRVVATVVAVGTLGFAGSGVAMAADGGDAGARRPEGAAGQVADRPWRRVVRGALRVVRGALRVSAETIGVPVRDLVSGLRSGQTVEQFARSEGVDPAAVAAALEDAANRAIDAALARGAIGEQRAQSLKGRVPQAVDRFVSRSWPRLDGRTGPLPA